MCAGKRSLGWASAKQPTHLLTHKCADSSPIPISVFSALQYQFCLSVLCNTDVTFQCIGIQISVLASCNTNFSSSKLDGIPISLFSALQYQFQCWRAAIPISVFSASELQYQFLQTFYKTLTSSDSGHLPSMHLYIMKLIFVLSLPFRPNCGF